MAPLDFDDITLVWTCAASVVDDMMTSSVAMLFVFSPSWRIGSWYAQWDLFPVKLTRFLCIANCLNMCICFAHADCTLSSSVLYQRRMKDADCRCQSSTPMSIAETQQIFMFVAEMLATSQM